MTIIAIQSFSAAIRYISALFTKITIQAAHASVTASTRTSIQNQFLKRVIRAF
jgi:hypothetical protein